MPSRDARCRHATRPSGPPVGMPPGHAGQQAATEILLNVLIARAPVGMPPGQVGHVSACHHAGHLSACHQAMRARQSATGIPLSTKVLIARHLSACHHATRATCRHATRPCGPGRAPPVGMPPDHASHLSACHHARQSATEILLNKGTHRARPVGMPSGRVGQAVVHRDSLINKAVIGSALSTCHHATRPPVGMPPRHAGHLSACHQATRARQSATEIPAEQRYSSRDLSARRSQVYREKHPR